MSKCRFVLFYLTLKLMCCFSVSDASFPHIVPKRLQFFEYESIHLSCKTDNSTDMTVLRTVKEIDISRNASNWMTSRGFGTVNPAFSADSGAYWCEDKEGHKSNTINISVTGLLKTENVIDIFDQVKCFSIIKKNALT